MKQIESKMVYFQSIISLSLNYVKSNNEGPVSVANYLTTFQPSLKSVNDFGFSANLNYILECRLGRVRKVHKNQHCSPIISEFDLV